MNTMQTPYRHGTATKPVMIEAGLLDEVAHCQRGHVLGEDSAIVWNSAATSRRCRECYSIQRRIQKARRDGELDLAAAMQADADSLIAPHITERRAERAAKAAKARRSAAAKKGAATRRAKLAVAA